MHQNLGGSILELIKIWYNTNIEKIILYGAGIWGGKLTKKRTAIQ